MKERYFQTTKYNARIYIFTFSNRDEWPLKAAAKDKNFFEGNLVATIVEKCSILKRQRAGESLFLLQLSLVNSLPTK